MKTIKTVAAFFATIFGTILALSLATALITWTPVYQIIHSPCSFFTFMVGFIIACLVVIELEESQNN
jgi:hypothetical protein